MAINFGMLKKKVILINFFLNLFSITTVIVHFIVINHDVNDYITIITLVSCQILSGLPNVRF